MRTSSPDRDEIRDLVALGTLPGVGDIAVLKRVAVHGSARAALTAEATSLREAARRRADTILQDADRCGARVLDQASPDYPERLRDLSDAPPVVFARGRMLSAEAPAVAIVGTRQASAYGLRTARAIASACASAGAAVISGLARGIDGAAHEATLARGGRTVAVLGTGVDVYYPRAHRTLQDAIATDGLLLSELPPGASGHAGSFPRRNRIIAALADVVLVVEAGRQSGALITAECGLDLGRTVACVPNAIDVPGAFGSNALLKRGAEPILSADDVLALLSLRATPTASPVLDANAAACWTAVLNGVMEVSAIAVACRLPLRAVMAAVSTLEVEGLLHLRSDGTVCADASARGP